MLWGNSVGLQYILISYKPGTSLVECEYSYISSLATGKEGFEGVGDLIYAS